MLIFAFMRIYKKKQVPEKIQKIFLDDDCDNKKILNLINLIYILFLVFLSLWINISIKMEFMRNASHLNIIDQVEYVISFLFFSFLISALFSSYFFPSLLYSTLLYSTILFSTLLSSPLLYNFLVLMIMSLTAT